MLDHVKLVASTCENLFSKNNQKWKFIFEVKGLFEISKNKNLSKITSYTILVEFSWRYPPCLLVQLLFSTDDRLDAITGGNHDP